MLIMTTMAVGCGSYQSVQHSPIDTCELVSYVNPYKIVMDTMSDTLDIDDTMFVDELIVFDSLFCEEPVIDSAYVYKNADYTFYIEYYFKSKTITYFICEGYIRKRQVIYYERI
jgi:hypothetical protein